MVLIIRGSYYLKDTRGLLKNGDRASYAPTPYYEGQILGPQKPLEGPNSWLFPQGSAQS